MDERIRASPLLRSVSSNVLIVYLSASSVAQILKGPSVQMMLIYSGCLRGCVVCSVTSEPYNFY